MSMIKRTNAEYESNDLPVITEGVSDAATSEVAVRATTKRPEAGQITVGIPKSRAPTRVVTADVEVEEGSVDEMAHDTEAEVGELETRPFWALLIRASYEFL